jgi:hypothetical protein
VNSEQLDTPGQHSRSLFDRFPVKDMHLEVSTDFFVVFFSSRGTQNGPPSLPSWR